MAKHRKTPSQASPAAKPSASRKRAAAPGLGHNTGVQTHDPAAAAAHALTDAHTAVQAQAAAVAQPTGGVEASEPATTATSLDIEAFSRNLARMVEQGGKALSAYLKPRENLSAQSDELTDVVKTLGHVAEYWMSDPQRAVAVQAGLGRAYLDLWANAVKRLAGEPAEPVVQPDARDKRFADPEWTSNQYFDFLKQAYLVSTKWADTLVKEADTLDPHTRQKADFYVKQIASAVSPSNFVLTNPELLRETLSSNADNLARGMKNLADDIDAGKGNLKISQSDASKFEVGRNLALTPGKVIFQNDLMQLIQYEAATAEVLKVPLLIVPPWINKFYVLDLTPEKSFIKWCVDQGITVFVISWVNPDAALAAKSFEDYMREGPIAALEVIEQVTGEKQSHTIGYCVGGTLLSITLAYLAAKQQDKVRSATLFAAQVDFANAGDLMVFVDEEQIASVERQMTEQGYLAGSKMANAFNMLRPNDLIWPYVINNYLKGNKPFPFDLLYWNSDATRMPAANHSFYLRHCYLANDLTKGKMEIAGETLDLHKVTVPVYNLATREDHIAPAKSVAVGSKAFGGPMRFVLAGSGHIAGVINPPARQKYQYWVGQGVPDTDVESWISSATEHKGSWWPDWARWLKSHDPAMTQARTPGGGVLTPIEDAPGSYVRVRD